MQLRNIFFLGVKELWSLVRDPIMLVLIVFAFTVSVYTATSAIPDTLNRATIAVVDEDRSPLSARIIGAFYAPYFMPPQVIDQAEMDARMDAGLDTFAINIPPEFQRDVLAGRQPDIQLNVDATRVSQAFVGSGYVQNIVNQEIQEFAKRYRDTPRLPVDLALRARFNPELNKSWFGAIMQVINQITMLSIVLTGTSIIRERERGTIEHLLVMPVTPFEIMMSKIWSMSAVVLFASTFSLAVVVRGLLGVPVHGSALLFFAGTALYLFATASMGIVMGTVSRSMQQFGLLMILILLPLQMLSGGSTPRESMPEWVQQLMLAAPSTHFVIFAQSILYRGAEFDVVWPQMLIMFLLGALFFGYALRKFRNAIGSMS